MPRIRWRGVPRQRSDEIRARSEIRHPERLADEIANGTAGALVTPFHCCHHYVAEERQEMWIGLIAVVVAIGLGLGVAAFLVRPAKRHS